MTFRDRILPALRGMGFRQDDYWVWCGSVAEGDDGRYHMFAARWPKDYPFYHGYLSASEVVRASADAPAGPYIFEEVVLLPRGPEHWDGRMTHNPFIVKYDDEFLLFYIGATYEGSVPSREEMDALRLESGGNGRTLPWYSSIRIGMARSSSVFGPWQRPDRPTLDINPVGWDNGVVTNPSPCVAPDGRVLLYYRSTGCKLGLAVAASPDARFVRLSDSPVVDPGQGLIIEDPFVFWADDHFEMVCKDLTGNITGEFHAAVHLVSDGGTEWHLAPDPKAWSRTIHWDDGSVTTQASIERPFILFESGRPAFLFAATADGPGPHNGRPGHYYAENTWNMVMPLDLE
jgi:hypothetical protein